MGEAVLFSVWSIPVRIACETGNPFGPINLVHGSKASEKWTVSGARMLVSDFAMQWATGSNLGGGDPAIVHLQCRPADLITSM